MRTVNIERIIKYIIRLFDFDVIYYIVAIILFVAIVIFSRKLKSKRYVIGFLFSYLFLIAVSTIVNRQTSDALRYNLAPFWTYSVIIKGGWRARLLFQEVILNVLMLLPVGIFVPELFKTNKLFKTIVYGFSISILIELMQLFFHRGLFEIDDIMHNTFGCFLGCIIHGTFNKHKINTPKSEKNDT